MYRAQATDWMTADVVVPMRIASPTHWRGLEAPHLPYRAVFAARQTDVIQPAA